MSIINLNVSMQKKNISEIISGLYNSNDQMTKYYYVVSIKEFNKSGALV